MYFCSINLRMLFLFCCEVVRYEFLERVVLDLFWLINFIIDFVHSCFSQVYLKNTVLSVCPISDCLIDFPEICYE
jgi:hypothetical protein